MSQLSIAQLEQVAALHYDPGFILLLDLLQATVDDLSEQLHGAEPAREAQILGKWRACREFLALMKTTPEEIGLRIEQERAAKELLEGPALYSTYQPHRGAMSDEHKAALHAEYKRRMSDIT